VINDGLLNVRGSFTAPSITGSGILLGSGAFQSWEFPGSSVNDITLTASSATRLIVSDLILLTSSSVLFGFEDLAGDNGFLDIDGNLTLAGNLVIRDLGGLEEGTYTLFHYSDILTQNGYSISGDLGGFAQALLFDSELKTISLQLTSIPPPMLVLVPEPGTGLLLGAGLAALAERRRRRAS
jgi:hypothetical protein